mgnify:CR=1 FL=1
MYNIQCVPTNEYRYSCVSNKDSLFQLANLHIVVDQFLATLVALHFTPVSELVGES